MNPITEALETKFKDNNNVQVSGDDSTLEITVSNLEINQEARNRAIASAQRADKKLENATPPAGKGFLDKPWTALNNKGQLNSDSIGQLNVVHNAVIATANPGPKDIEIDVVEMEDRPGFAKAIVTLSLEKQKGAVQRLEEERAAGGKTTGVSH